MIGGFFLGFYYSTTKNIFCPITLIIGYNLIVMGLRNPNDLFGNINRFGNCRDSLWSYDEDTSSLDNKVLKVILICIVNVQSKFARTDTGFI
jgi:hypothetical protein